jgi:4-alpha-glucanotransferase
VALMGDLPIFIAHHSADCWARPDLYYLDADCQPTVVAGCPPDAMAPTGQRWGNPLYRWDRMAAENYAWWTAPLRRALHQADVFRIDHFRGFAGYYEIPAELPHRRTKANGCPAPAKRCSTPSVRDLGELPIVAEDLGLITEDVIATARRLRLPRHEDPAVRLRHRCVRRIPAAQLRQRDCVAYTGTHDNDTVRGWWDKPPATRERAYAGSYLAASDARCALGDDPRLLQLGRRTWRSFRFKTSSAWTPATA